MKPKIIILLLLNVFIGFSQVGKVSGKLILEDLENRKSVIEKTYVILKIGVEKDSVKVDENLSFSFENLKTGDYQIWISPRNFTFDTFYKFHLEETKPENFELKYASTCQFGKSKVCPICKRKNKVIPICYGLGAEIGKLDKKGNWIPSKKKKCQAGGCIVTDCQPKWYCERDKKSF